VGLKIRGDAMKIIPLTANPDQTLTCTLPVDNKNITLNLRFRYNTIGEYWWMSATDAITSKMLIDGVPLVTGEYPAADLLEQYAYLGIGSAVIVPVGSPLIDRPTDANLGTEFVLLWGDTVG
jgi:hypothetical protein